MTQQELQTEIGDKLNELWRITDHYIPLSQQGRFSEYDNIKQSVNDMAIEWVNGAEDYRKLEDKVDDQRLELQKIKIEIINIQEELDDIGYIDESTDHTMLNEVIEKAIKDLNKIVK